VADHPKSGLTNGGGIRSKILMVLNGHPKGLRAKEITSLLVAAGNEVEEKSIGTTLAMMAKQKQVRRISKGLFGPRGK
jgi:Fe2+ or Zn2+ uptake regulation protein